MKEFIRILTLKRYSRNTINAYTSQLKHFFAHFPHVAQEDITDLHIRAYIMHCLETKAVSASYQEQLFNALKTYYYEIWGRPKNYYQFDRPRRDERLPCVLNKDEVRRVLAEIVNLKHQCIIGLIYSAGLRLGEAVNLTLRDIDSARMMISIRQGKGNKDRYSILSGKMLEQLRVYYRQYLPKKWLFEGWHGARYSPRSVQLIFEKALERSGIDKPASVHTLRHSFATHLLESGVDIRYIQELLGHESTKTTEIYTHVSNRHISKIESPMDHLYPDHQLLLRESLPEYCLGEFSLPCDDKERSAPQDSSTFKLHPYASSGTVVTNVPTRKNSLSHHQPVISSNHMAISRFRSIQTLNHDNSNKNNKPSIDAPTPLKIPDLLISFYPPVQPPTRNSAYATDITT